MEVISVENVMLGTVQLGLNYGIANTTSRPSKNAARRFLDYAFERGIRAFDTAPAYGESESIVGAFAKDHTQSVSVFTKAETIPAGLKSAEAERLFDRSIEHSVQRIGEVSLAGILLHSVDNLLEYSSVFAQCCRRWDARIGLNFCGCSVYGLDEVSDSIAPWINCIQAPLNVFDHRALQWDTKPRDEITFVFRSVFLQGLFFADETKRSIINGVAEPLRRLHVLSKESEQDLRTLCLGYVKSKRHSRDYILFGVDSESQLDENLDILQSVDLDSRIIRRIDSDFADVNKTVINPFQWGRI